MLVMFLLTYGLIACLIDDCADAGFITQDSKNTLEPIIATIIGILGAIILYNIVSSINTDAHYKVTVEINNPAIKMENLSETPTLKQLNAYFYAETIKAVNQPTSDISYFRKANTKLYKEADKIYFTTAIWKGVYGNYKTPEQFKNELSGLIQYTVTWANRYIKETTVDKAAMQKFTEQHATDTKTMPKFEEADEQQNKEGKK